MERVDRKNALINAVGEGFWGFGGNLVAPLTVLALLITRLGGSKLEVGLLSTIGAAAILFPPLAASFVMQKAAGKRKFLILYHIYLLFPFWVLMGVIILFLAKNHPFASRILLPITYAIYMCAIGFMLPLWMDWIAGLFKKEIRGTAIGWASASAAIGGTVAAFVAGILSPILPYPWNYAALFFIGVVFFALSMVMYIFIEEPPGTVQAPLMPPKEIIGRFKQSLAQPNYRRYLVSRLLLTAGSGPIAFFAVHYKSAEGGGLSEQTVIALGSAIWISQALMSFGLGRLGDALGHRMGAALGALAQAVSLVIAIFVPGSFGLLVAFAMTGVGIAAGWVSHQNLLFETCPHDCRSAHITITNLVLGPLTTVVPLLTGKAVESFGTPITFGACLLPTVLGIIWLLVFVKEPRALASEATSTA
jgi:MFS family permease